MEGGSVRCGKFFSVLCLVQWVISNAILIQRHSVCLSAMSARKNDYTWCPESVEERWN